MIYITHVRRRIGFSARTSCKNRLQNLLPRAHARGRLRSCLRSLTANQCNPVGTCPEAVGAAVPYGSLGRATAAARRGAAARASMGTPAQADETDIEPPIVLLIEGRAAGSLGLLGILGWRPYLRGPHISSNYIHSSMHACIHAFFTFSFLHSLAVYPNLLARSLARARSLTR